MIVIIIFKKIIIIMVIFSQKMKQIFQWMVMALLHKQSLINYLKMIWQYKRELSLIKLQYKLEIRNLIVAHVYVSISKNNNFKINKLFYTLNIFIFYYLLFYDYYTEKKKKKFSV